MIKAKLRDSTDSLGLPENFEVGQAMGGGDCFFDSVEQGLKRLKPQMDFTVKSLRKVCKDLAVGDQQLKSKVVRDARSNYDPSITNPDDSLSDDDLWNAYLASIEYASNDLEKIKSEDPNLYQSLTNSKYGSTLQVPIWGRPNIEGQVICKKYGIKLHIVEKFTGFKECLHQIVDESGSRTSQADYNDANTIYIVNKGSSHFEPILSTKKFRYDSYKIGARSSEVLYV